MVDDRLIISPKMVSWLIESQFPQWAHHTLKPVALSGWDNATYRLGDKMKVRLPRASRYEASIEIEQLVLPRLAPHMTCIIPTPIALGRPDDNYSLNWSVQSWISGSPPCLNDLSNASKFAEDLANNLADMQQVDAHAGPTPNASNFYRGGELGVYSDDVEECCSTLGSKIDITSVQRIWHAALASQYIGAPKWVHGDVAVGNLLEIDGRLNAVIDFGAIAAGDPACDLTIAWTFFEGHSRKAFINTMTSRGHLDDQIWLRAQGWALWKALFIWAHNDEAHPNQRSSIDIVNDLISEQ